MIIYTITDLAIGFEIAMCLLLYAKPNTDWVHITITMRRITKQRLLKKKSELPKGITWDDIAEKFISESESNLKSNEDQDLSPITSILKMVAKKTS